MTTTSNNQSQESSQSSTDEMYGAYARDSVGSKGSSLPGSALHQQTSPKASPGGKHSHSTSPPSMMYRKNFGKTGIYVPPKKGGGGVSENSAKSVDAPASSSKRSVVGHGDDDVITREDLHSVSDEEEEEADNVITVSANPPHLHRKGFPLTNDRRMISVDESRPFDERLQEGTNDVDEEEEDIEPPSLRTRTIASPNAASMSHASGATTTDSSRSRTRKQSPRQNHDGTRTLEALSAPDRFNLPPPRISSPANNLLANNTQTSTSTSPRKTVNTEARRERGVQSRQQPEEDDSLFEFPAGSGRRGRVSNRGASERVSGKERNTPSSNLAERSRAAWERKNQHHRKAAVEARESSPLSVRSTSVSFDQQKDTVKYYEPDDGYDNTTLADRSLNSEYTKSAESEVEDLIKDIFLLGSAPTNPGRRKVKYSSSVKDRRRSRQAPIDDDETYETYEESEIHETRGRKKSQHTLGSSSSCRGLYSHDEKDDEDDNPLADVWNYMEGGIKSVGLALGFTSDDTARQLQRMQEADDDVSPVQTQDDDDDDEEEAHAFWLKILGKSKACTGEGDFRAIEADEDDSQSLSLVENAIEDEEVPYALSLEEDMRLVDLAMQAARSIHRLKGMEFDEAYEIDIATDIHFAVVDLVMPFGLIFQENGTGCWVTKVLPEGSASRTRKVQLGDQLAAIDGLSAINLKVEEISALVKRKRGLIELTFLRYVGPLRPIAIIEEEGYEVKPSIDSYRAPPRPVMPVMTPAKVVTAPRQSPTVKATSPSSAKEVAGKRRFRLFNFARQHK